LKRLAFPSNRRLSRFSIHVRDTGRPQATVSLRWRIDCSMETATLTARQNANLKAHAFGPGGGCPIGGTKLQIQRATEMRDQIAPELPGLTPADDLMLWQACGLMAKARNPRLDPDITVRLSGTAHRIITGLQRRYRGTPKPQGAELTDYLKHNETAPDEAVSETDQ
jgi:hypothetical protein